MIQHSEILNEHHIDLFGTGYAWGFRLFDREGKKIAEQAGFETRSAALNEARDLVPTHQ